MGVMQEQLIAAIKDAEPSDLREITAALAERFGEATVSVALAQSRGNESSNPFQCGVQAH